MGLFRLDKEAMRTRRAQFWLCLAWALSSALLLAVPAVAASPAPPGSTATVRSSPHGSGSQKSICLVCHDPHAARFTQLLRFPADDDACWACHDEGVGLPFNRAGYEASSHFKGLGGKPLPAKAAAVTLLAGEEGDGGDDVPETSGPVLPAGTPTCDRCHQPHGRASGAAKLLRVDSASSCAYGTVNSACAVCHPDQVPARAAGRSFVSLPVYQATRHANPQSGARWAGQNGDPGQCTACHDPHGTGYPSLLRAEPGSLCFACHTQASGRWTGEKSFKRSAHASLCLKCHNPHGAAAPGGRGAYPKALVADEFELCTSCHQDVARAFAESRTASTAAKVRSRHPVDQSGSSVHCVSCHNPHQVRQNPPGGWEPALTDPASGKLFTYMGGNTSQEFCLKCHDGSRPEAANIAAEIKDRNVVKSGFVWAGRGVNLHNLHLSRYHKQKCASCHDPHATTGTAGVNRGHLLKNMAVTAYQEGYPGFEACATDCHQARCASCHPAPPDWVRPQ